MAYRLQSQTRYKQQQPFWPFCLENCRDQLSSLWLPLQVNELYFSMLDRKSASESRDVSLSLSRQDSLQVSAYLARDSAAAEEIAASGELNNKIRLLTSVIFNCNPSQVLISAISFGKPTHLTLNLNLNTYLSQHIILPSFHILQTSLPCEICQLFFVLKN